MMKKTIDIYNRDDFIEAFLHVFDYLNTIPIKSIYEWIDKYKGDIISIYKNLVLNIKKRYVIKLHGNITLKNTDYFVYDICDKAHPVSSAIISYLNSINIINKIRLIDRIS